MEKGTFRSLELVLISRILTFQKKILFASMKGY